MSTTIHFTWNGVTHSATVQKEQKGGSHLWVLELPNRTIYLMSQKRGEWYCAELSQKQAQIIGRAIEIAEAPLYYNWDRFSIDSPLVY